MAAEDPMLTLYQFECSHYCEKARWALDYKGLAYRTRNLIPGPHRLVTERLAPRSHVPILVDGERVVQGSYEIIDYLDKRCPGARLTPAGASAAQEAHEWERYLDREIGVAIRCWFYFHALPERKLATRFLLQGAPWYGAPLYALIFPVVRRAMRSLMRIDAENAARSESQLRTALVHLNEALRGRRYLAGPGGFSRADLTACALLAPLCLPNAAYARDLPKAVVAFRAEHEADPFFGWVIETYGRYRHRDA
ncbi:MAG: glutathione S-transferase family protein [Gammaproteobacteria bacterium]